MDSDSTNTRIYDEAYDPSTFCVCFNAEVGGQMLKCRLSSEAFNFFGAKGVDSEELLAVFNDHRGQIEGLVNKMSREGRADPVNQSLFISAADILQYSRLRV